MWGAGDRVPHGAVLAETGALRNTHTGTPQGGILSPLLANIALSVLDEHIASRPGGPNTSPDRREDDCGAGSRTTG